MNGTKSSAVHGPQATSGLRILTLRVNGSVYRCAAAPQALLLDILREEFRLVGTKRGCDMGTCGCCNVLIDGKAVPSCLVLAFDCEDKEIQTVEGLSLEEDGHLHPLQEAWAHSGGSQCGFCTPGFLMTSKELLACNPNPSREEIERALSGNVCRCTGYQKIVDAVSLAAKNMREWKEGGKQ
ncbi:MAG TPA: (2Fe-2S)-binding protein [Planctomycetes bacterium]|nr:(2Fe-2S)-binding protein [Planctomycetota bacterium]